MSLAIAIMLGTVPIVVGTVLTFILNSIHTKVKQIYVLSNSRMDIALAKIDDLEEQVKILQLEKLAHKVQGIESIRRGRNG